MTDSDLTPQTIASPDGETSASFVPGANLLCSSLVHRGEELLHVGRGVSAYAERGKTMGIPLLYPWANRLSHHGYTAAGETVRLPEDGSYPTDPAGLPIHGAMPGELVWSVQTASDSVLRATLAWDTPERLALFPFPHELECEAAVAADGLTLTTTVRAGAERAVPVAFGYHPYLRIPDSDRRGWQVDLGASERLVLDERMIPTGERKPLTERDFLLGEQSFDDGLAGLLDTAGPPQFVVSDGERAIDVSFEAGYGWAQIYAPPGEDFICFEPMTAPTDALNRGEGLTVLGPGAVYTARFSVTVRP